MSLFKRSNERDADESVEVQAARWLARLELGMLRRDEEAAFKRWQEQPRHAAALASLQGMLEQVQVAAPDPGVGQMRAEALAQRRGPLLLGNVPAGVAAALLVVAVVMTMFVWHGPELESMQGAPGRVIAGVLQSEVFETNKGEQRAFTLEDGSVLRLNTQSRAEVLMTAERRSIRLLRGQALFDVAGDKDRPFVVTAGALAVTALGTQFDVRLDRGAARVVLMEGRVRVEPLARSGLARLLPMLDRHELNAGEQLVAADTGQLTVTTADIEQSVSWQHDRLIFRGETLATAVAEFNRYSDRQLAIDDAALASLSISGVFSISRPDNFLAAVATFYPVRIEARSARLTVLSLRPDDEKPVTGILR